ncbi:MAG: hypothetical protein Q9N34_06950 [Aquificota bacterium]|nr:hypothetical protein [Aquificota bacterium]
MPEEWHFIAYALEGSLKEAVANVETFQEGELKEYNLAILRRHEDEVLKLANSLKNELLKNMILLLYHANKGKTFSLMLKEKTLKLSSTLLTLMLIYQEVI